MNYSDYSLHGISPFYDQTIFVRCHLCRNIVKLPQLADHLDIRHSNNNNNDRNETQLETTNNNNSVNLAVNNSTNNKKGRKANDSNDSNVAKTKNAQTPTKLKNSTNDTSKTNANNTNVNDLQQLYHQQKINGSSNELTNTSSANINNSNDNHQLNVVEKIKNKIISSNSNNNSSNKQFIISDSTNDSLDTNNSSNHTSVSNTVVNKSLPKLIIKKDKNAANNEVFYLNNSNSSQPLVEPRLNYNINNNSSNKHIDTNIKLKPNTDTNDLVVNHLKSSLTYSLTKPTSTPTTKTKAYDPNKHCGVLIEALDPLTNQLVSQEPCTRSLSCKKHSINLRRAVTGRCKSFNELFSEYKDEKIHSTSSSVPSIPSALAAPPSTDSNDLISNVNIEKQINKPRKTTANRKKHLSTSFDQTSDQVVNTNINDHLKQIELINPSITNSISSISNNNNAKIRSSPSHLKSFVSIDSNSNKPQQQLNQLKSSLITPSSLLPPPLPPPPPPLPLSLPPHLNSSNLNENLIKLNLNFSNSMLAKHHPRPSAVTSFNARLTDNGGGYTLWNRKQDNLRLVLSNAFSQTSNFLDKNRCFTTSTSPNSSASSLSTPTMGSDQLVQTNDLNLNQNLYSNHVQQQLLPQKPQLNPHNVNSFVEVDNLITSLDNHRSSFPLHQAQQQPAQTKPKVKKTKLLNDDLTNQLPSAAKLAKLNDINYFNSHLTSHHHQLSLNDSDDLDHLDRNHLNLIDNASANLLQHYITTNSNRQQTKSVSLSPSPSSSSSSSSSTSSTMTSINLTTNGTNATNAYLLNTFN